MVAGPCSWVSGRCDTELELDTRQEPTHKNRGVTQLPEGKQRSRPTNLATRSRASQSQANRCSCSSFIDPFSALWPLVVSLGCTQRRRRGRPEVAWFLRPDFRERKQRCLFLEHQRILRAVRVAGRVRGLRGQPCSATRDRFFLFCSSSSFLSPSRMPSPCRPLFWIEHDMEQHRQASLSSPPP